MSIRRLDHVNFITQNTPATIYFYCNVIGLELGEQISIDTASTLYFYIPGVKQPVLHIGQAHIQSKSESFNRLASLPNNYNGQFSSGSVDHFCLLVDLADFNAYVQRLTNNGIAFESYAHTDPKLKQIWALDPSGIRVELNFA